MLYHYEKAVNAASLALSIDELRLSIPEMPLVKEDLQKHAVGALSVGLSLCDHCSLIRYTSTQVSTGDPRSGGSGKTARSRARHTKELQNPRNNYKIKKELQIPDPPAMPPGSGRSPAVAPVEPGRRWSCRASLGSHTYREEETTAC